MKCDHLSIKRAAYGSTDDCRKCGAPIVHDGKKWRWTMEFGTAKVRKMQQVYIINRHIEHREAQQ